MLKIIRKYQLIILVVGGSLLMFVFMFQPILGKLSPDPRKAPVGKMTDGSKLSGFDFQYASGDLAVLKVVAPLLLMPESSGGLGIEQGSGDSAELHWLLLTKQANDAGLIGESGEGRNWIPELAQRNALFQLQTQVQKGEITFNSQFEFLQAVATLAPQYEGPLARNVNLAAGRMGVSEDDVYRTLAKARGIDRLFRMFKTVSSYSDLGLMHAAKERFDTIAVDAVMIRAGLFIDSIPLPANSELEAFFNLYSADAPSDNEYFIGYTQPSRAKIGWLTLNKEIIESGVAIDRIELNKIWRTDHTLPEGTRKYPGDFSGERTNIEIAYRVQRGLDIMIEADKIIRSQVLQATRGLSKDGEFFVLSEDWESTRPTLEAIAQAVVDGLKEQIKVTIPLPSVEIHTDRWLNNEDISKFGGFGTSTYRIGSRGFPAFALPQASESEDLASLLTIQTGIPITDPASEDAAGNRYYAMIYDTKQEGPAETIDDVGYDIVLKDFRTIKAYEMLKDNLEPMIAQAQASNDLAPAIDTAMALGGNDIARPGVARNLLVSSDNVIRGRLASFVERGINTEYFRDAVMDASNGLDQLSSPEVVAQSPIIAGVPVPSARSIGLARIIAPRPLTLDSFNAQMSVILSSQSVKQIRDAMIETESSPFSLQTLSNRYGYVRTKKRADEEGAPEATDSESTES